MGDEDRAAIENIDDIDGSNILDLFSIHCDTMFLQRSRYF
jgi:hypothetical protein